jgi:hypothetical protein
LLLHAQRPAVCEGIVLEEGAARPREIAIR